ncbi:hypothetical protein FoTM2_017323 [Fusarium oxysporum f. sp. vasinfectum]|nr:hypothetical protein QL093DRAFT_2473772 [Fusarium oxysporum]KAK2923081.1 hypothetical protein FoTM2_017323 [Fusarium oxysporum f. sp. vasinfectum]
MKFSVTLLTILAGLAIANPAVERTAEAEAVDTPALDGLIEVQALDGNCVRCIRRGCGSAAVRCLRGRLAPLILACLAAKCGDDFVRCCA